MFYILSDGNTDKKLLETKDYSKIKDYVLEHNLPIDLGSTGLSIRCCHTEKPIIVSFADFYNKTNPSKEIMQQEFSSEIREFRKIWKESVEWRDCIICKGGILGA